MPKRKKKKPATLLAETLSQPSSNHGGGLGVELADLVTTVVMLSLGQIGITALGLAPGGVRKTGFAWPGPTVKPVHKIIIS